MTAIFNPTDPANYAWWRSALHKYQNGVSFDIPVDKPQAGYYKFRPNAKEPYKPVAIWYAKDGSFRCKVGADKIAPLKVWNYCAQRPISEEDYKDALANGFPNAEIGDNAPPSEEQSELIQTADNLLEEAREFIRKLPGEKSKHIETQEQADKADALVKALAKQWKVNEAARKEEKAPWDEGAKEVQAKWTPTLKALKTAEASIMQRISAFLTQQRQEAEKALAETEAAGAPEGTVQATTPSAGSENVGTATHLRDSYSAEVKEPAKAAAHYCNNDQILAIIRRLAVDEFKATKSNPPGVVVKNEPKAVRGSS